MLATKFHTHTEQPVILQMQIKNAKSMKVKNDLLKKRSK